MDRNEIIEIATVAANTAAKVVVRDVLVLLGVDVDRPLEMQKQMTHLRFWTGVWEYSATKIISLAVIGFTGIGIGILIAMQFHLGR